MSFLISKTGKQGTARSKLIEEPIHPQRNPGIPPRKVLRRVLKSEGLHGPISQKVFIKKFLKSRFQHKFINLFFMSVMMKVS